MLTLIMALRRPGAQERGCAASGEEAAVMPSLLGLNLTGWFQVNWSSDIGTRNAVPVSGEVS